MIIRNPKQVRDYLRAIAAHYQGYEFTSRQKGAVISELQRACADCVPGQETKQIEAFRRLVCGWLFLDDDQLMAPMHASEMHNGHWTALRNWIGAAKIEGQWCTAAAFRDEVRYVLSQAIHDMAITLETHALTLGALIQLEDWKPLDVDPGGSVEFAVSFLGGMIATEPEHKFVNRVDPTPVIPKTLVSEVSPEDLP